MTDEAWIEQSLARLETLEAQKAQHEAAGEAVPADLGEEIAALYEALESAADDEEPEAAAAPAPQPAPAPADPFASPAGAPVMPQAAPAAPVMSPAVDDYDDDFKPKGKGGLLAVAAIALLAAGGGGYWYMTQNKPAPAPAPKGETKVITASSVPEDTQEPQAAKGGAADKTPGTEIPEGGSAQPKRSGGGGGGGKKRTRTGKKKDDGRKVKIDNDSRDPLAGI